MHSTPFKKLTENVAFYHKKKTITSKRLLQLTTPGQLFPHISTLLTKLDSAFDREESKAQSMKLFTCRELTFEMLQKLSYREPGEALLTIRLQRKLLLLRESWKDILKNKKLY